ncbi:MAG TPA: hypothetical protein VMW36_03880 [Patescibacteria group bacterium]|nr:hypothetical protein [Patescibacteria group bacterium]
MSKKRGRAFGGEELVKKNTIKLFQKTIIEGKTVAKAAQEMDVTERSLYRYKKGADFRQMALSYLDDSSLKGVKGVVGKLVEKLDALKPLPKETVNSDGSTEIEIEWVADSTTQMKAMTEIIKIYGLHAPIESNVTASISISSDQDLFDQIERAERKCRYVQSEVKGSTGFEVVEGASGSGARDFDSRKRTILQGDAVPESK